jgi:hypothetical protein
MIPTTTSLSLSLTCVIVEEQAVDRVSDGETTETEDEQTQSRRAHLTRHASSTRRISASDDSAESDADTDLGTYEQATSPDAQETHINDPNAPPRAHVRISFSDEYTFDQTFKSWQERPVRK